MQCKVQTQWKIYFHFKLNIIIFKSQIQASGSEYTSAKFSVYFLSNPISAAGCFRVSCFRTNWIFNNSSSKSKARASHLWWLSLKCLHNKLTCVCIVCTARWLLAGAWPWLHSNTLYVALRACALHDVFKYNTNFSKYFQQQLSNRINLNYAYMDCNTGKLHTLHYFRLTLWTPAAAATTTSSNIASVPVIYIQIKFQASADGMCTLCAHSHLLDDCMGKMPVCQAEAENALHISHSQFLLCFSLFFIQNFIYMYIVCRELGIYVSNHDKQK